MGTAHIGSNLDDFLKENKILTECTSKALKSAMLHKIEAHMADNNLSDVHLQSYLGFNNAEMQILMDKEDTSISLHTICMLAEYANYKMSFFVK